MSEYIERGALLESEEWDRLNTTDKLRARAIVMCHPAADVVEVKRGEWVWKHRHHGGFHKYTGVDEFGEKHTITVDERSECDEPYCPYCGKWNESVFLNYCPNCGAKMDGET